MSKPILMVVDDQPEELALVQAELCRRYAADYEVCIHASPDGALAQLAALHAVEAPVVLVLAGLHDAPDSGAAFLARVAGAHPHVQRVLLLPKGHRSDAKPVMRAITQRRLDRFVRVPDAPPDERFHAVITEMLDLWERQHDAEAHVVTIVGPRWNPRCYELRDLLHRGGLSFAFVEPETDEGRALLARVGHADGPFPLVIRFDGRVLVNPSDEEAAREMGARHSREDGVFDLAIVGAGPAGLSAAVYGGSEGLRTIVVDREVIGGQASTSAMIRNYLGFPFGISGAELTNRALDQAWSFGVETSILRPAIALRRDGAHHILAFANDTEITARAVVLATGARYERLGIPSVEELVGKGVFYGGGVTEAPSMEGQHVFVAGAGNSAGQAAVHLARFARRVTLIVRGEGLAASMSDYLIRDIEAAPNIDVRLRTIIADASGHDRLESLVLREAPTGAEWTVPAAALFVLIGVRPHTDWLPPEIRRDPRGFILTGTDLDGAFLHADGAAARAPLLLETSVPGVFAAGDARHGSVKRVASAVGEGGIAIQSVHRYLALRAHDTV